MGTLTTQDEDEEVTFVYSLVDPAGTTQNSYFFVDGNQLKLAKPLDFETLPQLKIHVVSTASSGLSTAADFILNVGDVDESPPVVTSPSNATATLGAQFKYKIVARGGVPITYAVGALPAGLTFSGDTIRGVPSIQGLFTILISATNPYGAAQLPVVLVIGGGDATPLSFASLSVKPNPGHAGEPLDFSAAVESTHQPQVAWDFGDGSTGAGAAAQHVYDAPGIYTAVATVTDGVSTVTQSLTVAVSSVSLQLDAVPYAVRQAVLKFDFKKHADSLKLTCDVPLSPDFAPEGQTVELYLGGYEFAATLSVQGEGGDALHHVKLAGMGKDGRYSSGAGMLSVSIGKKNLFDALNSAGFVNAKVKAVRVPFCVALCVGGQAFVDTPKPSYTATVGKSGNAIFLK